MDHRSIRPTERANAAAAVRHEGIGLFGMGVMQRLAISAVATALIAAAAWWALG